MKEGNKFGAHRVIEPKGVLPQPAKRVDNTMEIYDNEILIDVDTLNVDAASFTQIEEAEGGDVQKMARHSLDIIASRGKHHNPDTGSGRHAPRHRRGDRPQARRTATSRSAIASRRSSRCRSRRSRSTRSSRSTRTRARSR